MHCLHRDLQISAVVHDDGGDVFSLREGDNLRFQLACDDHGLPAVAGPQNVDAAVAVCFDHGIHLALLRPPAA